MDIKRHLHNNGTYCNDHDALASAYVLITLIPAYLLYVSQHTESAHA